MKAQKTYCPICNKEADTKMGNLSQYWFCNECVLGWIKVIPKTSYTDEYYISGSSVLSKLFSPLEYFFSKIRESYTGFLLKNLWVDVGAGEGKFLEKLQATKKIGIEVSLSGRNVMKKKGLSVMTNNEFLKIRNLNADVISFWHVLEHIDNPIAYIRAAEKNLNLSGKIIIAVPNIDSFEFRIFGKSWFHLAPQYHLWFFSPHSLKKMLTNASMKIEAIDYWAAEHHLSGVLQSFINRSTGSNNILHKLIRRKQDLSTIRLGQTFWIIFWCTFGFPLVLLFWVIASVLQKPGATVVVAKKL